MSNEDISEINIIYNIKRDDKYINIFGWYFVCHNENKCKMIIDNKEYKITEKYNAKNYKNKSSVNGEVKGVNYG